MDNIKFRIGAIFSDVGIYFRISHKVVRLIWDHLEKEIDLSDEYTKVHKDYTLVFLYSAREGNDFFVTNPTISKRYKVVEYVVYMPYKEIQNDIDIYNLFLFYMEKGIRNVFERYNIDLNKIEDIFLKIRMKVIGNKEYLP